MRSPTFSDRHAVLDIADTAGKPCIRIGVDRNNKPSFAVPDGQGKFIKQMVLA